MNTLKDLRCVVAAVLAVVGSSAWAQDPTPAPAPDPVPNGSPASVPGGSPAPDATPATPEAPPAAPATPAAPETATPAPPPAPAGPPRITVQLPPPPPAADDLPIPTLTIDRIPPNTSYEFAVQVSYGQVAYFRDQVPPWVGFGFRGGWGKNFGVHRIGVSGTFSAEGDIGVHTQLAIEPALTWDFVSGGGFLLGAGVGPAVAWTARSSTIDSEYAFEVAPSAAVRLGWSQTWSRVGRRLFLFVEPKARMAGGKISPLVAVAVGSGGGR